MGGDRNILPLFAPLMRYPHSGQAEAAALAVEKLADQEEVAGKLREYGEFLGQFNQKQLEEKYTQTFEINPAVALEVGFHLFGLAYQRGQFLARVRQATEELGVETGSELADHLPVMLELAAALNDEMGVALVQEAIFPAVRHMAGGFVGQGPGYGQVVLALHVYLETHYECIVYAPTAEAPEQEVSSHA